MCVCALVYLLWHIETNLAGGDHKDCEETVESSPPITQNTSKTEHTDEQAQEEEEGEEEEEEEEEKQEQEVDHTQEQDQREMSPVQPQQEPQQEVVPDQDEAVPDQDEALSEDQQFQDAVQEEEPEPEQVDTFFSTMSHRYGDTPQEGHIL